MEQRMRIIKNRLGAKIPKRTKLRLDEVAHNSLRIGSPISLDEEIADIFPSAHLECLGKHDAILGGVRSNHNYLITFKEREDG